MPSRWQYNRRGLELRAEEDVTLLGFVSFPPTLRQFIINP